MVQTNDQPPSKPSLIHGQEPPRPKKEGYLLRRIGIGFLQLVPMLAGVWLTEYFRPLLFPLDYLVLGIACSLLIGYLLSGKVPPPPIQLRHDRPA